MSFRASALFVQALQRRGVTLRALATQTQVPLATLGMIANGERRMAFHRVPILVTALGLTKMEARQLTLAVIADHGGEPLLPYLTGR